MDLFADLLAEATKDWTTKQRDAFVSRIKHKAKNNPDLWATEGRAEERREKMIEWLNEEASRFMEAAAILRGVGVE